MRYSAFVISLIIFPFLTPHVLAQVLITEIMYDLEGPDSKREWIEVRNESGTTIDLSTWKLFEGDTNHGLTHADGPAMLSPGAHAVIADNADTFLIDWSSFQGLLFDSSFSLNNVGETLVMRDENGVNIDSVTYSADWGAAGDGNSLQLLGGSWKASSPTPGNENFFSPAVAPGTQSNGPSTQSTNVPSNENSIESTFPVEPQIFVEAGEDRMVIVGADVEFRANGYGLQKKPLSNARYIWNFGDGALKEGQAFLHTYLYPGTYVVTVTAASGEYSAVDRVVVTATNADISLSYVGDDRIELSNHGDKELDLSWWRIESNGIFFTLPKNTKILPRSTLTLAGQVTELPVNNPDNVRLLYPNGVEVKMYEDSSVADVKMNVPIVSTKPAVKNKIASKKNDLIMPKQASAEEETNTISEEDNSTSDAEQIAGAIGAISPASGNLPYKWLFYLTLIVGTGIVGVLLVRRDVPNSEADAYEILDDES